VGSGIELGQDQEMDDLADRNVDGDLDVDLAELSLGQRLTALSGAEARVTTSDSDDEAAPKVSSRKKSQNEATVVPANSLTRTLIQALHSSDSRLLETCLAHSDQMLIRNTVKRLPPQLAVPLITACVERLGRGARAGNMKGGGGGASSQRGTGLITWVKTTLAVHSGHLMTVGPNIFSIVILHRFSDVRVDSGPGCTIIGPSRNTYFKISPT
jgi:U3 small nucleolar RNA-associated protein 5